MPLRFLLDENQRGVLWHLVLRHNARGINPVDVVADVSDLPLGSSDAAILHWAKREERILVTNDKATMPQTLSAHLTQGNHCSGILMLTRRISRLELLEFLVLAAYASEPDEWQDRIRYLA